MGRDKALLPWGTSTLIAAAAEKLKFSASLVTIVGPVERYAHLGFPVLPDLLPGLGPLSGLQAALRSDAGDWNLILACDMPLVPESLLSSLFDLAAGLNPHLACVVPRSEDGGPQPLCAAYHTSCLPAVEERLDTRRLKMMDLIANLNTTFIDSPDSRLFRSANTPEQWAALQTQLS